MSNTRSEPDCRLDVSALAAYLEPHVGGLSRELSVELVAGGRSNPTYELSDGQRSWILRRPPYGHVLPTAHDMRREYRVLTALGPTPVPVPPTVVLCEDESVLGARFYVMDKLEGTALRTRQQAEALTPEQRSAFRESMVRTLADLHQVDPDTVGLADFGRPDGYLERQVRRWRAQWNGSQTTDRLQVERLVSLLRDTVPTTRFPGIVHGDYKTDNVMVDPDDPARIIGVLDWEMSTLGDTLADLGMLVSFWDQPDEFHNPISAGVTALKGFGTRAEVLEAYAAAREIDLPGIDWYVVFADFKVAIILEGIHRRHLAGHTSGDDFEGVGAMVGPLLDRALDHAAASPLLRAHI